jgi:hypothetical protein
MFQHIPCTESALPKPILLHTMQIGMLDYLQKLIFCFRKTPKRLEKKNGIWLSMPTYHDVTLTTKSYDEDSQWNGKEMKETSQYLIGVVT